MSEGRLSGNPAQTGGRIYSAGSLCVWGGGPGPILQAPLGVLGCEEGQRGEYETSEGLQAGRREEEQREEGAENVRGGRWRKGGREPTRPKFGWEGGKEEPARCRWAAEWMSS